MASQNRNHLPGGDENRPFAHTYVPVDPFKPSIAFSLRNLSATEDTNLLEDDRPPIRPYRAQGPTDGIPRSHNRGQAWYRPAEQLTAAKPAWRTTPTRPQQGNAPEPSCRMRSRSPESPINRGRNDDRQYSRSPGPRAESRTSRIRGNFNLPMESVGASSHPPSLYQAPELDQRSISSQTSREYDERSSSSHPDHHRATQYRRRHLSARPVSLSTRRSSIYIYIPPRFPTPPTAPGDEPSQPVSYSIPTAVPSIPSTIETSWSHAPITYLHQYLKLKLSTSYVAAFLIDTLPRQIYLNFHLRLPYIYFSRVTRIFEEAEMSMPMIRQGILDAARANALAKGENGVFVQSAQARMLGGGGAGWGMEWEPSTNNVGYTNLQTTWLAFVDALLKEWKTLNIISVLLLSAILTILQLESAASDPLTRCTALLSMICALISLVYGCIYIIRFGTMKKTYKGAAWAQEAQRHKSGIWWNIWVMLALPATWLAWSVILYIATITAFVWRTSPFQNPVPPAIMPSSTSPELLIPRVLITTVLSMGICYFILIVLTLQRYGETMDRAWQERIWAWMQHASESDAVDAVDAQNNASSWKTWKPGNQQFEEDVVEKEVKGWGKPESENDMSRDNLYPKSVLAPLRHLQQRRREEDQNTMSSYSQYHLCVSPDAPFSESVRPLSVKDEKLEKDGLIDRMAPVVLVNSLPDSTPSLTPPLSTTPDHNFISQHLRLSLSVNTSDGMVSNENDRNFENVVTPSWAVSQPQAEYYKDQMTCVVTYDGEFPATRYPSEAHDGIRRTISRESLDFENDAASKLVDDSSSSQANKRNIDH